MTRSVCDVSRAVGVAVEEPVPRSRVSVGWPRAGGWGLSSRGSCGLRSMSSPRFSVKLWSEAEPQDAVEIAAEDR